VPSRTVGLFLLSSVLHTHRHLGPRDRKQQLHGHTREIGMQSCSNASETCSSMDGQAFALFPLMGRSLSPQRHLWPKIRIECSPTRSGTREFTASRARSLPETDYHISLLGLRETRPWLQCAIAGKRSPLASGAANSLTQAEDTPISLVTVRPLISHGECDLPPTGHHMAAFVLISYLRPVACSQYSSTTLGQT
jgi:hypothetical protein